MKTLQVYQLLKNKVKFIYEKIKLFKYEKTTGRKLKISIQETVTLALYKQTHLPVQKQTGGIPTKKSIWNDFKKILKCCYKTLVVNLSAYSAQADMNKCSVSSLLILKTILQINRDRSHFVKHTDLPVQTQTGSTNIPVCLNKNGKRHKTMYGLANWGHSGKGMFFGVKLHLTSDLPVQKQTGLKRKMLSISITSGNKDDRSELMKLNKDLKGIFIADAGYVSEDLEKEFYIEHKRILFAKPRKNMKKVITFFQKKLYDTRMIIEINFRNLKMLYNLITSFPRSINGYFANYIYSILAYALR